jgi:hypothetical protein
MTIGRCILAFVLALSALVGPGWAQYPPGEGPALGTERIEQSDITGGGLTLDEIRAAGLAIFATPFNKHDGYGDGPVDWIDTTSPGRRPTLQDNGTFLRVNGLDSQNCQECHSVGSNAVVPFRYAIGGVGGSNNNAIFQPKTIDVDDEAFNGFAAFDGRYINPPFLFGSGGVELVGKEMTGELRRRQRIAFNNPDSVIPLVVKGVDFGSIVFDSGTQSFDTSNVEGVDEDLVVRPFGRKGEFSTTREFDVGALQFHLGMQPVEEVGENIDGDGDGVVNEILVGELSALHVFDTNLERPTQDPLDATSAAGAETFSSIGCSGCHKPFLDAAGRVLTYSFPVDPAQPTENTYYAADLASSPAGFDLNGIGGIRVPLFSDLKRHDMGDGLAESFGHELDREFITARLWGVADTAPYLHDGRALTLTEAILQHGGEAQAASDSFAGLSDSKKIELLGFLRTLRTPVDPAVDLLDSQGDAQVAGR